MPEFQDLKIVNLDVSRTRSSPTARGLRLMHLSLSASPPGPWGEIFEAERSFPRHNMWRRAWIEGAYVVIDCVPEEIEQFHLRDLKQDVANTNAKYRQYLEKCEKQRAAQEEARKAEETRLGEVKRRLKFD